MSRPRPTVSSPNEYDAYFRQAQVFADCFAVYEGVEGCWQEKHSEWRRSHTVKAFR